MQMEGSFANCRCQARSLHPLNCRPFSPNAVRLMDFKGFAKLSG